MIQKRTKLLDIEVSQSVELEEKAEKSVKFVEIPLKPVFSKLNGKIKRKFTITTISKALLDEMSVIYPSAKVQQIVESAMLHCIKSQGEESFNRVSAKLSESGGDIE